MVIPRAGLFLYAVALVYFMICLFVMVTLMTTLHGSRSAMCEKMRQHNVKLNIRYGKFFQISNVIGIISLFIGSWGSYIIIPPGCKHLKSYRFLMLFRIVDLAQLAYSVQKFVLDFLAAVSIIENGPIIPDTAKAQFFTSFLLVCEMLFVSVLATILFRPSRTLFFDKYNSDTGRVGDATLCSAPVIEPHPLRIEEVSLSTDKIDKNHNSASTRSFYAGDFYSLVVRENREHSAGTVSTTASNDSVDKKL
ncbi:Protein OSTA-1 [Aphelenchoides avenae]|nr:Protein OSTA-1 [Aphelenchus avenae]